ncbi:TIGR04086 family membrane protein [Caldisalinibacter kiritimatiensis]|uniref:Membrane protein, TIGR04086 family n=1 Tax=Caldisalinibacter kiritimatiensis TaxID=1304284 RepID=R1AU33_9FIRM|nr:TIGR04086 family membrane protein [Caldisalinibacter kiritimatiensis]EOD00668.1 hypothetical protein L21TH_1269 [Caldisalinibacter kiritimatiensis]
MRYKNSKKDNYALTLIKGVILSFIITLVSFIVFALILTYTNITESVIPTVDSIIMILSIAIGSIYVAFKVYKKGWLNGAIVGLAYIAILIAIRRLISGNVQYNVYLLVKVAISIITGVVGGMIGINIK